MRNPAWFRFHRNYILRLLYKPIASERRANQIFSACLALMGLPGVYIYPSLMLLRFFTALCDEILGYEGTDVRDDVVWRWRDNVTIRIVVVPIARG